MFNILHVRLAAFALGAVISASPLLASAAPAQLAAISARQSVIQVEDGLLAPIPTRRIAAGEIIRASDIEMRPVATGFRQQQIVEYEEDIVGFEARRAIPADRPVRTSSVQMPSMVKRGELVTMMVQTSNMLLSARGKALEDGGKGDVIRLNNLTTNKTLEGTVVGAGTVHIMMMTMPTAIAGQPNPWGQP